MRYFPCDTIELSDALLRPEELGLVREAADEVLQGLNRCLVTFGERGTGKTRLLFGSGGSADADSAQGLVGAFLHEIFAALVGRAGVRDSAVALAAGLVRGNRVEDLCGAARPRPRVEELTLVDCPTLAVAEQLLRRAVRRAAGGESAEDRAHLILRVLVHQTRSGDLPGEGVVGSLVIADLVGTSPVTGADFTRLGESDRVRRRLLALHLHTFLRVLEQMSEASQRAELSGPLGEADLPVVTAARDSALTALLCPVLQGNAATTVFAVLGNGEEHFAATRRTLTALEPVTRISCAVYSCSGVRLSSLRAQSPSTVLPRPLPDPLLSLRDGGADIDLERLAYGNIEDLQGTSGRSGSRKAATDWSLQLGELMSQLHATLGADASSHSAGLSAGLPPVREPRVVPEEKSLDTSELKGRRAEDVDSLRLSNSALLAETEQLRTKIDQLRQQLVETQDASDECRIELETRLSDREVTANLFLRFDAA